MRGFTVVAFLVVASLACAWADGDKKKWSITLRNVVGDKDEECDTLLASVTFQFDEDYIDWERPDDYEDDRQHGDHKEEWEGRGDHNDQEEWKEKWREDDEEQAEIKCGCEHKFEPKMPWDGKKSCKGKVKVVNAHDEYFEQEIEDPEEYKYEVHRRVFPDNQHSIFLRGFMH
ncbi:hypothetical protein Pelo_14300 [Pelomyxa schiedti]|nr:hypothetical protein Pelo_14300 [Pelomyxa schiedti]